MTLGRPVAVRDDDIDVPLPTTFDIDELTIEELSEGKTIPRQQHTSPFLHLIAIRRIAGRILEMMHCSTKLSKCTLEEKLKVRQEFKDELQAWKADISNVRIPCQVEGNGSGSAFRSRIWYEVPYHNAMLLLYRPSPGFPPTRPSSDPSEMVAPTGVTDVLISAVSAIHLYAELHRTRRLNYSWITLHAVFIGGLSYVYSISRIIKETKLRNSDLPICLDSSRVLDVTRACSNVLVAINERWGAARDSCEIFEHLSTAIIQDSINIKAQSQMFHAQMAPVEVHPRGSGSAPLEQSQAVPSTSRQPSSAPQLEQPLRDQNTAEREFRTSGNNIDVSSNLENLNPSYNGNFQLRWWESQPAPAAENGFRQFTQNLQNQMLHDLSNPGNIPSEVAMGFSHDWFAQDVDINDHQSGAPIYNEMFMGHFV